MSYQGTMNVVKKISDDHDVEVEIWADELANLIQKPPQEVSMFLFTFFCNFMVVPYSYRLWLRSLYQLDCVIPYWWLMYMTQTVNTPSTHLKLHNTVPSQTLLIIIMIMKL